MREAIAETSVNILGEKGNVMYILGVEDAATYATGGTATAGRNLIVTGRMLKVAGNDASVGITLTDAEGTVIRLTDDLVTVNNPSQLILLLPHDLKAGEYTLTVTTQHTGSGTMLKTPRSVTKTIVVGG